MKVLTLLGQTQKIELEGLDRPQFLVFRDISVNTKISVVIERVGAQNNDKIFVPIKVSTLLEAQKKIERLEGQGVLSVTNLYSKLAGGGLKSHFSTASLQVAIGGEVPIGNNDKVVIYLTNMEDVGGKLIVKGGQKISTQYYKVLDEIFEANHREKAIDVNDYSYLIFENDETKFPEKIEKIYANQKDVETFETITADSERLYGLVAIDDTNEPGNVFGSRDALVLDVKGVKTLTLYNEQNTAINFYGVKFN
jgi:hypothetical protein